MFEIQIHANAQFATLPESPEGYIGKCTVYNVHDGYIIDYPIITIPSNAVTFSFPDNQTADHCLLCKVDEKIVREVLSKLPYTITDNCGVDVYLPMNGKFLNTFDDWKNNGRGS